jgi:hypothetical protein
MATADVELKKNDQRPYLDSTLSDADGAVNLTGATVTFFMQDQDGAEVVNTTSGVSIQSATAGTVRYQWAANDTSTEGNFRAEWRVNLTGSTSEQVTFPNGDWISVVIRSST